MRWSSVVWAGCALPVLAGCGTARHAVPNSKVAQAETRWTTSDGVAPARRGPDDERRRGARVAWDAVRARHPQRAFSPDFEDGFVDGYADSLDRGDGAQPPAVPAVAYPRYQKYLGPDGHALVRDYYLGFQYGAEVAVTGARRPAAAPAPPATAGAVPPRAAPDAGKFGETRKGADEPPRGAAAPGSGPEGGRAVPPLPKPEVPVIKPFNPDLGGGKFVPIPVPGDPERLPVPHPPLPVVAPLAVPPDDPKGAVPPLLGPLPTPVPVYKVPASAPAVLGELPVTPFEYTPRK